MPAKFIFIVLILMISNSVFGQYHVIQVNGRVKSINGQYVKVGSILSDPPKLQTSSSWSLIRVVDDNGHTFVFLPHEKQGVIGAQFISSDRFSPLKLAVKPNPIDRTQKIERFPGDLITEKHVVIQNDNKYVFDTITYPVNSHNAFYLQIAVPGKESILRPLKTKGDTLHILYTDFLTEAASQGTVNYSLFFLNQEKKITITDRLLPFFDETNQVASMVETLIKLNRNKVVNADSLYFKCLGQVYQAFGKPSSVNFNTLFDDYYFKKKDIIQSPKLRGHGNLINFQKLHFLKAVPELSIAPPVNASLPDHATLRQYTPIFAGDQGQTGTCVAWASAYGARSINYNQIHRNVRTAFSPEFIYSQLSPPRPYCDSGRNIDSALTLMERAGNLTKTDTTYNCSLHFDRGQFRTALNYKIVHHGSLVAYDYPKPTEDDVDAIKRSISRDKKPVIIAIFLPADTGNLPFSSFDSLLYQPSSGWWIPSKRDTMELLDRGEKYNHESHAMCIVAYNDTINGGAFQVLNSWGVNFGVDGYFWLNYGDFRNFGIEAWTIDNSLPPNQVINGSLLNPPPTAKRKKRKSVSPAN